jgi:lipocalin
MRKGQGKGQEKGKGQGKGKGERESTKALTILFLNCLGQSKKSANYTVLYRKERYSMYC